MNLTKIIGIATCAVAYALPVHGIGVLESEPNFVLVDFIADQGKGKPDKGQPSKGNEKGQPAKGGDKQQAPKGPDKQQPGKDKNKNQPEKKQNPQKGPDKQNNKGNQKGSDKNVFQNGKDQGNKGNGNKDPFKGKSNKSDYKVKAHKVDFKHPYDFGRPGKWISYGNNQGFYYGKNYGQYRSQIARNKHKQFVPVYEYQAIGVFHILLDRNVYLVRQTDHKIVFLRARLLERRRAGLITVVTYEEHMNRLAVLERRRANVEMSLNVHL